MWAEAFFGNLQERGTQTGTVDLGASNVHCFHSTDVWGVHSRARPWAGPWDSMVSKQGRHGPAPSELTIQGDKGVIFIDVLA